MEKKKKQQYKLKNWSSYVTVHDAATGMDSSSGMGKLKATSPSINPWVKMVLKKSAGLK